MILFSWTLTPNQIVALRAIEEHHRRDDAQRKARHLSDNPLSSAEFSHWITATRGLIREGFVKLFEVPVEAWERGRHSGRIRTKWEITQKGLLALELVAIEVQQQHRLLALDKKELKRIGA